MCRLPGDSSCGNQHAIFRCKLSTGVAYSAAIGLPGCSCKAESQPCGSTLSSFITLRFCVAAWQERLLAMLQKVIILVFATLASSVLWWPPVQDMSPVSITYKTVGIRLPCLWCGAIGRRIKRLLLNQICCSCSKNETLP